MKMPIILKRKKLSASTARRSRGLGLPDAMAYEEMSEPNMKLSRALLIVLLLHIVAVAGIIAFNTIKTREALTANPTEPAAAPVTESQPETAVVSPSNEQAKAVVPNEVTKVAVKTESKVPAKNEEHPKTVITPAIPDSGEIYVVVKGDNPVTIARHFHVDYDALLQLNQIEDPRRLQIGQKLHIPKRSETSKHKSD
ncbi:MAG TPA: LysM peptidoglycan-binding domain-containing protein [Chthoniobacterales bacterium]|jgi:LysM repeat protein|nr:LysM peptidoglycan-binding domain-containing protein [Chthoniobacterales bacterium]